MRYRDTEALIRTVCVKELGVWMKTLPDVYLESAYFKYVGWMLDDIVSHPRSFSLVPMSYLTYLVRPRDPHRTRVLV